MVKILHFGNQDILRAFKGFWVEVLRHHEKFMAYKVGKRIRRNRARDLELN